VALGMTQTKSAISSRKGFGEFLFSGEEFDEWVNPFLKEAASFVAHKKGQTGV
jgi:hypothetical protein